MKNVNLLQASFSQYQKTKADERREETRCLNNKWNLTTTAPECDVSLRVKWIYILRSHKRWSILQSRNVPLTGTAECVNWSGSETELGHKKNDQVKVFNLFSFFGSVLISYYPIFISTVTGTQTQMHPQLYAHWKKLYSNDLFIWHHNINLSILPTSVSKAMHLIPPKTRNLIFV